MEGLTGRDVERQRLAAETIANYIENACQLGLGMMTEKEAKDIFKQVASCPDTLDSFLIDA